MINTELVILLSNAGGCPPIWGAAIPQPQEKQRILYIFMAGKTIQLRCLSNAFSCHEFLDVSLFFLNGGWGGGSLPCGGRRGTAPCIRQYSDRFFVYYSYFAPQFLWYLSCSLLLSGPNLSLMGGGRFLNNKTYIFVL